MMTLMEPPSVLSSPQRRCQVLLMFYLPDHTITPEFIGEVNGVDATTARQDIAETGEEIQRYHRLAIASGADGSYRIEGTTLDLRLCLLHWLRRAFRLCPHFVSHHFTPALKTQLKQQGIARTLYDDTNLQALVNRCGRSLQRQFECRDTQFLRLYLQYCLLQHHQERALLLTRCKVPGPVPLRSFRWPPRLSATGNDAFTGSLTVANNSFWRCCLC